MSDVEAIQPLQELELFENPWLQERRELQLTTRQTIDRQGLGPGELGAELGLSRVLQVGFAFGATSTELEVGLGLLQGRAGAVTLWGSGGREDGGWSGEAALAAALDLERVVVVGNVGASGGDDGLQGVSGVALLAPLGRWVPHVEGRVASEGIAGAVGLRWHPIDAVEIGVAGRGHREGEKVRASVGVLLVFELGGEDA